MISAETIIRAAIALVGLAVGAGGAIFAAGRVYDSILQKQEKDRADLNGLGKKYVRITAVLVRWSAGDPEKVKQIADLIEGK